MKYYSEITKSMYNSVEELQKAEAKIVIEKEKEKKAKEKAKKERELRAKEVEKAFEESAAASKKANELLRAFCKDYGAFHTSLSGDSIPAINSLFDLFF